MMRRAYQIISVSSHERLMSGCAARFQLCAILCFHFNETNSRFFCPPSSKPVSVSVSESHFRRSAAAVAAISAAVDGAGARLRERRRGDSNCPVAIASLVIKFRHGRRPQLRLLSMPLLLRRRKTRDGRADGHGWVALYSPLLPVSSKTVG